MTPQPQKFDLSGGHARDERNIILGLNFLETEARAAKLADLAEAIRGLVVEYLSTCLQRKTNEGRQ